MLVHQILKDKSLSGVETIGPDATISEAAKVLMDKRIGTVVISGDGQMPDGILSERDIVQELAQSGSGCLTQRVGDYMTKKVVTCTPQSNVREILETMTEGRFRHMPVVENGCMVGLVSLGDVVKAQLSQLKMEKDALQGMIMGF
ncbi:MAG: CBS domain-containing protein [Marinibacterium sp.]